MEGKCPKCESNQFELQVKKEQKFCLVCCKECGTVIGALETLDVQSESKTMTERYNKIINNHGFFERRINQLENELNEIKNQQQQGLEDIQNSLDNIARKIH